jgi:hypothetical protein
MGNRADYGFVTQRAVLVGFNAVIPDFVTYIAASLA